MAPAARMDDFKGSAMGLKLEMEQIERRHKPVFKTEHKKGDLKISSEKCP